MELPDLAPNQVRVANEFLSVDPYMRGRMNDVKSYVPPFALNETMTGGAVGRIVESTSPSHPVGAVVVHDLGWRDVAQGDASGFRVVEEIPGVPVSAYLGILGLTGLTAYVGLMHIAHLKPGESVFISGAAGAVGTAAGQIARLEGPPGSSARRGRPRRWSCSPSATATAWRSTTSGNRCGSSCGRSPETASTSTSTTSAETISRPRWT